MGSKLKAFFKNLCQPNLVTKAAEYERLLCDTTTLLDNALIESGICCCGDSVGSHNFGSGHSPVDEAGYYAMNLHKNIAKALRNDKTRQ